MATQTRLDRRALPLLGCLCFSIVCLMLSMLGNEDLWWYLASGDEILARGAVPQSDPFLFSSLARDTWVTSSREQATWVHHSWLWTVWLAWLRSAFGADGLAGFAAVAVCGFAALVFAQGRFDRFAVINCIATLGVLYASIDRLALRAEMSGWLLFGVFAVLLDGNRARTDGTLKRGHLAALLVLQWFWSNLHGSYVLGLGLAFAYTIGDALQRRGSGGMVAGAGGLPLWLGPVLCVVSIATPRLGAERVLDAVAVLQQLVSATAGSYAAPIEEWQGTFASGFGRDARMHLTITALGLLGFAAAQRLRWARALVFFGMALLAASALRFVGGFAIATGLITMWNLSNPRAGWARVFRERAVAPQVWVACTVGALIVGLGVARFAARAELEVGQSADSFVTQHPHYTCPQAAAFIRENGLAGPIFNDVALGGYLIDALYPEHQLYIDTRNLSAAVVADYQSAMRSPEAWQALSERFRFRLVVLANARVPSLPLRRALVSDPNWELVYFDPQAAVFARTPDSAPQRFAVTGGTDAVPYLPLASGASAWMAGQGSALLARYLDALLELRRPEDAAALATRAMQQQPLELYWLQVRALANLQSGRAALAADDFARFVEQRPRNPEAQYRLALAAHRAGDERRALAALAALDALQPGHQGGRQLRRAISGRPAASGSADQAGRKR
jgi:hypothetical protein